MDNFIDKRSSPRTSAEKFYSVEFSILGTGSLYQFKIRDVSFQGMCILVKDDSAVLKHIHVGERLNMKYYSDDPGSDAEMLRTEIRHITKEEEGVYKGHYLVGLSILENQFANE